MSEWWVENNAYADFVKNNPKPLLDPELIRKEADKFTGQMDIARKYNKEWISTPESAARDTADLFKSLDANSGTWNIERVFAAQNSPSNIITSVDPAVTTTINQLNNKVGAKAENPNQMKDAFNNIWNMISKLSPELWKLFEKLLGFLGVKLWNTDNTEKSDEKLKKMKNEEEQRKILDNYGVKIETPNNGTNILSFMPNSKVEWSKTLKVNEWSNPKETPEKLPITWNKDGTLSVNYEKANSVDIKETSNGFVLTVNNKDGSIDTYAVKSEKKPITPSKA